MENFRNHAEVAYWQRCNRAMKYYLGYYGWIPAIIAVIAAAIDATGLLPNVLGKLITLLIAVMALGSLGLQRPEKDEITQLSESMHVPMPSFPEATWFLFKYRMKLVRNKVKHS